MNIKRYCIILTCLITASSIFADRSYYYKSALSLTLIKDGVHSFLEQTGKTTEQEMEKAIHETISLAHRNQTDTKALLENLKNTLDYRIDRIEYQLEHQHSFNRQDLLTGAAWIGVGVGLCALIYLGYEKLIKPGYSEFERVKNETESMGTRVVVDPLRKTIDALPRESAVIKRPDPKIIHQQLNLLANIHNSNSENLRLFCISTAIPFIPFGIGAYKISSSFKPNADNQNLDKYKLLSKVVDRLQKEHK